MINSFSGRWAFLSNFYPCKITFQGITYPSSEHYYVAMKVKDNQLINGKIYCPADMREMISKVDTAGKVKRLGKSLDVRKDWNDVKLDAMQWAIKEKFSKNLELKEMLLQTGTEDLVEGNFWHDCFWGVCSCEKCGNKGENHLGKILMKIRSELSGKSKTNTLENVLFPKNN